MRSKRARWAVLLAVALLGGVAWAASPSLLSLERVLSSVSEASSYAPISTALPSPSASIGQVSPATKLNTVSSLAPPDTVPVTPSKTVPETYRDIEDRSSFDLRTPSVVRNEFIFDPATGNYLYITTLNGKRIGTPISYTPQQYLEYLKRNENRNYFIQKEREEAQEEGKQKFNPFDFGFELGPAEKVFGPGGVKVRTQGSAEILLGVKSNATDNPSMPVNTRRHTFFNFDEKIQANVQASVGTKLNFNLNYNTETTFDFDSKKLKLAYEGEDDDIIKLVEAGNVSLQPKNSLIQGGASLFGIHTKLQFGKLDVNMVVSRQEAETKHVSTQGGVQTEPFEFSANRYDENRHFFLAKYFYDNYDKALSTLPFISSSVAINRVEIWVTNKRGRFETARNIVAFADLAEPTDISNPAWSATGTSQGMPDNSANTLYSAMLGIPELRGIENVSQALTGRLEAGREYEKLESARLLTDTEYTLNRSLGYITLNSRVANDEIVAVAFEYTYQGKVYRVGEFSADRVENPSENLYVKLVKGTTMTPSAPYWKLMMRNVYALGNNVRDVSPERFRLDVLYRNDSTGVAMPYLTDTRIQGQVLLRVLDLDKLDSRSEPYPDGVFDFVNDYTVNSRLGLVFFSSVEPFGRTLRDKIGDPTEADRYCYDELYDTTAVAAQQVAEKDKFILKGEYKAAQSGVISLGAVGVTPGSVRVTAGGVLLTENVDYTVNYAMGTVSIINESILASGTRVDVSLENKGFTMLQRKTMLGLDLNYNFSKDFTFGGTVMYLSEMPLTTKTAIGNESLRNMLWGLNLNYRTESQRLTNVLDKIPFLDLTKPSEIRVNAEFAHLIPGHYESKFVKGYSYVDDFEASQGNIDLMNPYSWLLSSTPYNDDTPLFPEAVLSDDVRYGFHRARIAWFYIDPVLNRQRSSLLPSYIRNDPEYLSNHYSREVMMQELFPYRDYNQTSLSYLRTLNLSYYPTERGPYNLNTEALQPDGSLGEAEKNWGGIMRKIDQSDFEASNIEYLEFWLLDPFIYDKEAAGGSLYINLGEISEDILRDGLKFFENGLPINDDPAAVKNTAWGKVPVRQAAGYAFDNSPGARAKQDLGFNGLTDDEEKQWPAYLDFLNKLNGKVSAQTIAQWKGEPLSALNDPAADNFKHYRDASFDDARAQILDRYKYYNGVQGNSAEADQNSNDPYSIASRVMPDVEDANQDNTLNENEKYFRYRIALSPSSLVVGSNYITDVRPATVTLPNGKRETVNWYQFKIPVKEYERKVGGISDFKSIRFMRLFLTGFKNNTFLRFGTLKLVRGVWRTYDRPLYDPASPPASEGKLEVSTVNIEENGDREPITYVLPPGVLRSLDPSQSQATQQNEQSLSMRIRKLAPGDARSVYRNTGLDFRRYKRMELFVHAEQMLDDDTGTAAGDLSVFVRLGSDYINNYYEYSVPLSLTPYGRYSSDVSADRQAVWPKENMVDFLFETLTNLKLQRNTQKSTGNPDADFYKRYTVPDPQNARNTITVIGNPSLSNVKTIMIGVRNNANTVKSAEVWVNEFRLSDYKEQGGWAANADMQIGLSDWGAVNVRGQVQTAGFGALDQTLSMRRLEDLRQVNVSTRLEMGRFFPEKANVTIPFYYAYNDELITPQYNPLDEDILLKKALGAANTKQARDSIYRHSITRTTAHSLSLSNMRVDVKSKTPMPYDPANFSFSYSYNQSLHHTPALVYDRRRDWLASAAYDYNPVLPPLKPFAWIKSKSQAFQGLSSYQVNPLPAKISFSTSMVRNYSEQQVRNFIPGVGDANPLPATFIQNFVWDRAMAINWNLTSNLQFSLQSGTNARIVEPHVQVNRDLEPDKWKVWRDSVNQSIREMGLPMKYDQRATLSWKLPFSLIPYMSWVSGNASYTGTYNWDRGAMLPSGYSLGNIIRNDMRLEGNVSMSFSSLYRQIPFFQEIEKALAQSESSQGERRTVSRTAPDDADQTKSGERSAPAASRKPRSFKKKIKLSPDSSTLVKHGLNDKKIKILARTSDGKTFRLKTKKRDPNTIEILTRDTLTLQLTVNARSRSDEERGERSAFVNHLLYGTMMLRDINISYRRGQGLHLPGFLPDIRAIGGQANSGIGMAPGLDFAFGFIDRNYVTRAAERGWLTKLQENVNPSAYTQSEDLNIRVTLEPFRDLRITLTAMRNDTRREETQYVFEGMPRTFGGSFTMTTIGLKDFFGTPKAEGGYSSVTFQNLLDYRAIIADRLAQAYLSSGEAPEDILIGQNTADVLIPAFLAAYSATSPDKVQLSPFPSLRSLLPNWSLNYTGLSKLPGMSSVFRNFSLSHNYMATYSVGSYNSILGWQPISSGLPDLGFVRRVASQNNGSGEVVHENQFSMPYDIPTISLQEGFNPLLGVEITVINGVTASCRWNKRRAFNLSPVSAQVMESNSNELSASISYKVDDAKTLLGLKRTRPRSTNSKQQPLFASGGALTVRFDYSYNRSSMLIRKIQENFTLATNGNKAHSFKFSADYDLSRLITLRAYFDWNVNTPLVSSASFPTRNTDFGISLRINLTQ